MAETAPPPSYVIAMGAVWPPLCLGIVMTRFYARYKQNGGKTWTIDDWLIVPALILTFALGIIMIIGVATKAIAYPTPKAPPGVDQDDYSSPQSENARRDFWLFKLCQVASLTCIKLSFVFFYRRIFVVRTHNRSFDLTTKIVIGLLSAWGLACFLSLFFACRGQFDKYWHAINIVEEYCPHTLYWENTYAVTDMALDLVVFCLPFRQVAALQLTKSKRIAIFGVFGLGAMTIAASVVRMAFYIFILRSDFQPDTDNDLIITSGFYWSMLESGFALVVVNVPPIYSLINTWRLARKKNTTHRRSYVTRSQWVRNLANFRAARTDVHALTDIEALGFRTTTQTEATHLDDPTPPPKSHQIRVGNCVEITYQDASKATSERAFPL